MNEQTDKYWICSECAEAKGWKIRHDMNTLIFGICGHCDSQIEEPLTPTRDYVKPRETPK